MSVHNLSKQPIVKKVSVGHGTCDEFSHYVSYMTVKKMQQNGNKLKKCDNFGYVFWQTRYKWQLNTDKVCRVRGPRQLHDTDSKTY